MAKLIYESEFGTYTVEVNDGDVEVYNKFIDYLVRPISAAAGWAEKTITDRLGEHYID